MRGTASFDWIRLRNAVSPRAVQHPSGGVLEDKLEYLGIDVDTPWRELPKKTRDWILFTDEQPTVPVYPGFTPAETRTALRKKTSP